MTHTPGPWGFEGTATHGYGIVTGRVEAPVADLVRTEADARLIAAAPQLLEALRDMVCKTCGHPWCDRARQEIRRAGAHA